MFHFLVGEKKKDNSLYLIHPARGGRDVLFESMPRPLYIVIGHDPVPGALLVVYSGRDEYFFLFFLGGGGIRLKPNGEEK